MTIGFLIPIAWPDSPIWNQSIEIEIYCTEANEFLKEFSIDSGILVFAEEMLLMMMTNIS